MAQLVLACSDGPKEGGRRREEDTDKTSSPVRPEVMVGELHCVEEKAPELREASPYDGTTVDHGSLLTHQKPWGNNREVRESGTIVYASMNPRKKEHQSFSQAQP